MKAIIQARYLSGHFRQDIGPTYDGHLTIHIRFGAFYPEGHDPLLHKTIEKVAKSFSPEYTIASPGFGQWKGVVFLYVNEEDCPRIFERFFDRLADALANV